MVYVNSSVVRSLEKPKSAIFIYPSCINILASLKSLCMILCLLSVLKALSICTKNYIAYFSVRVLFFLRYCERSPSLQY